MGDMDLLMSEFLSEIEEGVVSLNFATNGLGVIVYVLQALALYTIAQRRGIKKPWLAWIPVVSVWILGSISDQYRYVVKREVKNKRKVLLGLNIATAALLLVFVALIVVGLLAGVLAMEPLIRDGRLSIESNLFQNIAGAFLVLTLMSLPLIVLSVVHAVYFYMAIYDVFCSCDPKNSTLYLVLSLVGNFIVEGAYCIFLMLCKDKDLGMPPRKAEVEACIPQEPEKEPWDTVEE